MTLESFRSRFSKVRHLRAFPPKGSCVLLTLILQKPSETDLKRLDRHANPSPGTLARCHRYCSLCICHRFKESMNSFQQHYHWPSSPKRGLSPDCWYFDIHKWCQHVETKRRCHSCEVWRAVAVAQAHWRTARTHLGTNVSKVLSFNIHIH